jgi:mono/diheme cytochrome c family protein
MLSPTSLLTSLLLLGTAAASSMPAAFADDVDYTRDIQPLLARHCYECHGPDTQEGRLRLDRRSSLLRGGDSGEPAIIPAKPELSHLLRLVRGEEAGKRMPPEPADKLTPREIQLLEHWIASGAVWPGAETEPADEALSATDHWAFRPISIQSPPALDSAWIRNGIDAWILQRLRQADLQPNPPAAPVDRLRRLSLDLHGLPPAPATIQKFAAQSDIGAWESLVETALSSPHYGERWAQHWLDLVRFAETNGFETNRERPNAWPYRDYVIRAFNEDKPYNQFLREQIAGDALGVPEATAFLVAGPWDIVKSPDINLTLMQRQNELDDMLSTTASAFLGLTLGCARCHNHKFDPIRQTDYYAVQAVFAGVQHGERRLPPAPAAEVEAATLADQITSLRKQLEPWLKSTSPQRPAVTATYNQENFPEILARSVRLTIEATNSGQPCIDELQVFSGSVNVALASRGTTTQASGTLPGYAIHQLKHINDGQHGNDHSWIADQATGWVQLNFPQTTPIQRIEWARDRNGQFKDRVAVKYRIEAAGDDGVWKTIASSTDRQPFGGATTEPEYDFAKGPEEAQRVARTLYAELRAAEQRRVQLTSGATIYAGNFQQPGPTYRLFRGEPGAPREQIAPNGISFLAQLPLNDQSTEQERRLIFANWVAANDNPLTARVIVNRLWQWHFGRGLVATPSDFGLAGTPPTHPELLDWLAAELIRNNWSIKHIQRLILTSATYQQSGEPRPDALEADAGTELWWRFPPRRLEAEPIRDCILSVTGVLNPDMYGPGFNAFEVQLENVRHYFPRSSWGPAEWRRMIYQTRVRLEREAVFGVFELFAQRLQREFGTQPTEQITGAFRLCFSRNPDPEELQDSLELIQTHDLQSFCRALLNSNEFVFLP